jgi:hypothetical protein
VIFFGLQSIALTLLVAIASNISTDELSLLVGVCNMVLLSILFSESLGSPDPDMVCGELAEDHFDIITCPNSKVNISDRAFLMQKG